MPPEMHSAVPEDSLDLSSGNCIPQLYYIPAKIKHSQETFPRPYRFDFAGNLFRIRTYGVFEVEVPCSQLLDIRLYRPELTIYVRI